MQPILAAGTIADFFRGAKVPVTSWHVCDLAATLIAAVIHATLLIHIFALSAFFFIWLERKVAGRIQDRLGPTRVGGKFGWLQSLADGIKLIQKEDLCPSAADGMLFRVAPYIACAASFAAYIVLPLSDGWVAVDSDIALFILLGLLSLEVVAIVLAGYSSGSKWSLFGGMREAAQMVSYEIPLALSALIPIVAAGTLNLSDIARMQSGWLVNWLIFQNPFTFIAFFVYFAVATAECKRAPFDLAEAESELVGGFHTEYSGMRWSFFFMAEYASMLLVSIVASILFLGGWNTGIGPIDGWLDGLRASGAASPAGWSFGSWFANLIGCVVMLKKGALLVFVQIWVRWTLPRLRIDQVMLTCFKYLLPICCFLFLGAVIWPIALTKAIGRPEAIDWKKAKISRPLGERAHEVRVRRKAEAERSADVESTPATPAASHVEPKMGRDDTTSVAQEEGAVDSSRDVAQAEVSR